MGGLGRRTLEAGARIDRYLVNGVIGIGMQGVAYAAVDQANPNRPVILKEYFPIGLASRQPGGALSANSASATHYDVGLSRFVRGTEPFLRNLAGPNLAGPEALLPSERLLETNNTAYRVLPAREGMSVRTLLGGHTRLASQVIVGIASQVLDGLRALHDSGTAHGDLTPDCIIFRPDESVALHDVGVVLLPNEKRPRHQMKYAAPEVLSSEQPSGPLADLYAVGAILFQCLTGAPPPPATVRERLAELGHADVDPVTTALRSGRTRDDGALLETIRWMLSLSPSYRPPDAVAALTSLSAPSSEHAVGVRRQQSMSTSADVSAERRPRSKSARLGKTIRTTPQRTDDSVRPSDAAAPAELVTLLVHRLRRLAAPRAASAFATMATSIFAERELIDCVAGLRSAVLQGEELRHRISSLAGSGDHGEMQRWLEQVAELGRSDEVGVNG